MNKSKKIISILAAATLALSTVSLAACGGSEYKGETLAAKDATAVVASTNGGFVVETGDYVYFINGQEANTANNTYGTPVKGALMRISKAQLATGDYDKAQVIVPSLFVAGDYDSGIYIYDNYVYYATPTKDKNNDGQVENSYLDFKKAKLDGTTAPMDGKNDYFLRLSSNTTKYRFVKEGNVVYLLYEEDGSLKSYNTTTKETTVLVSGAGTYYYDKQNKGNPTVYYTMSVTYGLDTANSTTADYNQIYSVNASATATVTVSEKTASYTVKGGKTYSFDREYMEDNGYDLNDYTTYPYVNLGTLVLDGVGTQKSTAEDPRYNDDDTTKAATLRGYKYTMQSQDNGGIYFTREENIKAGDTEKAKLYYLPTASAKAATWNTVTGNNGLTVIADDTTNASSSALFTVKEGVHTYYYLSGTSLKKVTGNVETTIAYEVSSATLWTADDTYLYYYGTGTNGKNINRVNHTGTQDDYYFMGDEAVYAPVTLPLVDFNDSWYKPEFVTLKNGSKLVMYSNAQSYGAGSTAYNYIYAAKVGTNAEITAAQETIDAINEEMNEASASAKSAMTYYFRTGSQALYEEVIDEYSEKQQAEVTAFIEKFTKDGGEYKGKQESSFISLVGKMNEKDGDGVEENWKSSLLQPDEDEDDEVDVLKISLIVGGITLACAIVIAVAVILLLKKKNAKKKEAEKEAIVHAYKRKKIDVTDDATIDVYADETPAEEETEAVVEEETVVEEAPAEESVEAPVEE